MISKIKRNISCNLPPLPNPHFEPLIEIISDRQAEIEGCNGIIEYNDSYVSVNCKSFIIGIKGENISIKSNAKDCITINGKLDSLCFSSD